jgi:hypothetical protein
MQANLGQQLTPWLYEFDKFFRQELPFGTSRVGGNYFTNM